MRWAAPCLRGCWVRCSTVPRLQRWVWLAVRRCPATVIPFLLRGVNLLGIDSVMQPFDNRVRAWARISKDLPMDKLEAMVQPAVLSDLPGLGRDILKGQVKGRVVVDVNG